MIIFQEVIAFDLDGTLAKYDNWKGLNHIGEPIIPIINKLKKYLANNEKCCIFTARATSEKNKEPIKKWLIKNIGREIPITNIKNTNIKKFYDDRAIAVEKNTGKILGGKE